ncbi:DUF4124 domain-containing protein [Vibrio furnissii]|uniref:DUF4124 domain-containing protein n=1 Tax=Vibrio furnissii TaxID=29494 RepID=UPI0023DC5A59|nr:DUF4124 domain-containing protein [Vibrio furnissii]
MIRIVFLGLLLLLTLPLKLSAQSVYTWEDEQGVVHFSDAPADDQAQAIHLPDVDATPPAPSYTPAQPIDPPAPKSTTEPHIALQVTLSAPHHDQTIRDNRGRMTLEVELNRPLGVGEHLQLLMDGKPYGAPSTKTVWHLNNIERGSHTFSIQAFGFGKVIASSQFVTVHLHRASVN